MQPLVGREEETAKLRSKIEEAIDGDSSFSCYISGRPGTGKTATVKIVTESLASEGKADLCYINCSPVKTTNDLYKAIATRAMSRVIAVRSLSSEVSKFLASLKKHLIIVLDEVDHLCSKKQEVLYTAFKWPCDFNNVILLGIANSLDLTERLLPKLKLTTPPEVFVFKPYSTSNLVDILKAKLANEENIDPKSIELCARKVAVQTGDVRQAMSIAEQMLRVMSELNAENAEVPETPKHNACKAVLNIMSKVQDSPLNRSNIPQHPKVILATMIGLMRDTRRSYVLRDRLFAAYHEGCQTCQIPNSLDRTEFAGALQMLEAQGIVRFDSVNRLSLQERRNAAQAKLGADQCAQHILELNFASMGLPNAKA
uniref:AAA domain-containing protein n=1 Tax=Steinernema glaseri TaxID=37863 RepID=A0A1I7ZW24_9BILA